MMISDTDIKIRFNVTLWPWFLNFLSFYCQAEYAVVNCDHGKHFRFKVLQGQLYLKTCILMKTSIFDPGFIKKRVFLQMPIFGF